MSQTVDLVIEQTIKTATGDSATIVSRSPCGGGCINNAETIQLADGRQFFVKTNSQCPADMFEREAEGLQALAASRTIAVPNVIGFGNETGTIFLVLEAVEAASKSKPFYESMGEQLAQLHRQTSLQHDGNFGFCNDNYLGSSRQPNTWTNHWIKFWLQHRLGFQFDLARNNGYTDNHFNSLADKLISRLGEILATDEPAALIHGDLWSGNYMRGANGEPVLIDPAAYFASREAEFGMITLFGGVNDRFYDAYNATWPLADGANDRIAIYRLYHLLNHLNLFGTSYMGQCLEIIRRFA